MNRDQADAGRLFDGAISRFVYGLTARPPAPEEELDREMAKFRSAREGTIALIQDLTQTQVDFIPAERSWSVGQVVRHLLLIEELYQDILRKLLEYATKGGKQNLDLTFSDIDNSLAFIPREVIPRFAAPLNVVNTLMPRAMREAILRTPLIPALNPTITSPDAKQPVATLRARALAFIDTTEEIFRRKLPPNLMSVTMSHPLLGSNNVAGVLGILSAHEERHHVQIRRVLANPRFPAKGAAAVIEMPLGVVSASDLWPSGTRGKVTPLYEMPDEEK